MENAPLISIIGYNLPPQIEEKYNNWTTEVYIPNLVKLTPIIEINRYHIIKKNPSYPDYLAFWHQPNLEAVFAVRETQFFTDFTKDIIATFSKVEWVWRSLYSLMRSFRNLQGSMKQEDVTTIEDAPFILLEAYRFTLEEEEKYVEWFARYANRIYIPLLMKIPGVKGFDRYRYAGKSMTSITDRLATRESNYPSYLQIVYFENEKAYENYEKSPELASVKKAMKSDITDNIVPQWYVQYQLLKSWRK